MREYSIKFRALSVFACIDDKHRIGSLGSQRQLLNEVIVSNQDTFVVGDHDFCKFSFIPSVILLVDIPESMEGSWYAGEVFVGIKDAAFEPSSPIRHATELYKCLA